MGSKRGFTLIELLVVISIIALLLAILVPSLQFRYMPVPMTTMVEEKKVMGKTAAEFIAENVIPEIKAERLIIMGDYNNHLGDEPLNLLEKTGMRSTWRDLNINVAEKSTHKHIETGTESGVIDHILCNVGSGAKAPKGGIIYDAFNPPEEDKPMPQYRAEWENYTKPLSDHRPIWAELSFPQEPHVRGQLHDPEEDGETKQEASIEESPRRSDARTAQEAHGELLEARKIWDKAPHNAFTDLIRYKGKWFCVFREGKGHAGTGDFGSLRVITSSDGETWTSAAEIRSEGVDLRDPKLCVTPENQLMLNTVQYIHNEGKWEHQSLVLFSTDGHKWSEPHKVGDYNFWLWRTTWHKATAYSIGYYWQKDKFIRLYASDDGKDFKPLVDRLYDKDGPNEHALTFLKDDTCLCLLRRDNEDIHGRDNALLGIAKPAYTEWEWKDLGVKIGGPEMIQLPDGRIVAAVRKYEYNNPWRWQPQWTELCWLDADKGKLEPFLKLPSGGDCSYAGLVWHEGVLWVSYYSSHEGKTSIYLAKVKLHRPVTPER